MYICMGFPIFLKSKKIKDNTQRNDYYYNDDRAFSYFLISLILLLFTPVTDYIFTFIYKGYMNNIDI